MQHSNPEMSTLTSDASNDSNPQTTSLNPQPSGSIDHSQGHIPTRRSRSGSVSLTRINPDSKWYHKLQSIAIAHSNILIPSCYAFISAMIGSQSVVLAKSSSFLITESIGSDQQFTQPVTYFFIIAWGVSMTFWLYRMNTALRKYEGVFIIPLLQVLWMLFSILSGGILFKEFDGYSWYNYFIFMIGTIIIFYGVYKLSPKKPDANTPKHKNQKEIELLQSNNNSNESLQSASNTNSNDKRHTPSSVNIQINSHSNSIEERIDPVKVRANLGNLRDNDDLISASSMNQPSINSLRNSGSDPAISEHENVERDSTIHDLVELAPDPLSLRTIHKFFTTSQKMLSTSRSHGDYIKISDIDNNNENIVSSFDRIMKVTGADGRTHLSGPSLSSLLTAEDLVELERPSFSYNPYNSFTTNDRLMSQREIRNRNLTYQPQSKPDEPIVTQSLPAVMPSDLKNAFEKIRLDNLKEEQSKKEDTDALSIQRHD